MTERHSDQNITRPLLRHSIEAPAPAPMKRQPKPETQTGKPLLAFVTREESLTSEQKQPLSAREKPKPAEAVFPPPLPSKRADLSREANTKFYAAKSEAPVPPMKRHTVTAEETRAVGWQYTPEVNLQASTYVPNVETGRGTLAPLNTVHATVVKLPVNKKPIILSAIAIFLALVIILGCIFGINPGTGSGPQIPTLPGGGIGEGQSPTIVPPVSHAYESEILSPASKEDFESSFKNEYAGTSAVGVSYEYVGGVDQADVVRPSGSEVKNENENFGILDLVGGYPQYGKNPPSGTLGTSEAAQAVRNAMIAEANYLNSTDTKNGSSSGDAAYNMMDKEGKLWLYKDGAYTQARDAEGNQRMLYKHTVSVGLYGGNVSDDEPRIIQNMTMRPRGYDSYSVTGLYAPAGELIKVEISEKDMNATGGLTFHIGQALYNGKANNIWTAKNSMPRWPVILNTMVLNKNTATFNPETGNYEGYIGSFIGGPIYIRNKNVKFSATITGGVRYSHFILGYTTEAEFKENAKSSAPYFDLEVWHYGILHSGPKQYAASKTYDELYKVAVLWEKVAAVTTTGSNQGIVMIYDPFVAAGAAVAFPGQQSVNCPAGWMENSLNYNTLITSGAWGNFHEYHHNFQGYGVGEGGEVTNNGMTLVSYALFTKISAARGIGNFGSQGLSGWNRYTSAAWALEQTLKIARDGENPENGNKGLALYATLLHNFGPDNYIKAKAAGGGQSYAAYMNAWQKVTHNNMYYYFNDILKGTGISDNADSSYPMFVPVSSVYQTGRSYMFDGEKKYFTTMRPFTINAGEPFEIDLTRYKTASENQPQSGSIVMPEGFEYRVKSVTMPANGTIEVVDGYHLKYTPAKFDPSGANFSGQIIVTLEITKTDGAFKVDDVDLILEFETTNEMTKSVLQRTVYTFNADTMYTDATAAYEAYFSGAVSIEKSEHSNFTQNCNTDMWYDYESNRSQAKYANAPDYWFFRDNTIDVLEGKLHFDKVGKYRIFLRGRSSSAVYYSMGDNTHFTLGAKLNKGQYSDANFHPNDERTYFDIEITDDMLTETGYWVYVKEILVVDQSVKSFIGLGMNAWTQTMFTASEQYYDENGEEVESPSSEGYQYTERIYSNSSGIAVAGVKEDKNGGTEYFKYENGVRVPSTIEEVSPMIESTWIPPTSAAYVNAYNNEYEIPLNNEFETDFYYVRTYNLNYTDNKMYSGQTLVSTKNYNPYNGNAGWRPEYLVDGDKESRIHTNGKPSEEKPLEFVIDMGEVRTVNRMIIHSRSDLMVPMAFKLYGSMTLNDEDFFLVYETEDAPDSAAMVLNFEEATFRYYKLSITQARRNYIVMGEIEMWHTFEVLGNGANQVAPFNYSLIYRGDWSTAAVQSTFGYAYLGKAGSTITFEMIGTRLAILTNNAYENDYEVYIDGALVSSIPLKADDNEFAISYLSQKLASGKHKVEIKCKSDFCLDSIAIFNET